MSRVELAKIRSLTFYKDSYTAARRTSALPQLVCVGKPCKLFQPEVVRCISLGGTGTEVDWKCETDLPDSLRFGRVEVSCEGWSRPGDPYVLKGSCSLEYRLVQISDSLRTSDSPIFSPKSNGSGYWFPGGHQDNQSGPPPPYSKNPQNVPGWQNWRPGFWTGAALGGLANHLWNRPRTVAPARQSVYDWERVQPRASFFGGGSGYRQPANNDRGEGPSNLGPMRRSTGLGGSNVR
ncbi:DUF1183-domain-containing protein [Phlegmacium glaucopus]|nr:DUF1183-domain-containing protein [Phlegmacium glaucopus]